MTSHRRGVLYGSATATAVAVAMIGLSGCNPPHPHARPEPKSISALDCPGSQGDLNRQSASADGKTCVYATDGGDQVTLRLVAFDGGDARSVLGPIESRLKTELPGASWDTGSPNPPSPPVTPDKQRVDIDLPGIHIHGDVNGHTNVDTPGVHVDAHDDDRGKGDHADVRIGGAGPGGVTVNADDGGARIRIDEKGSGVRATYILASEAPGPHGYKAAGYEARGPSKGPIVVAEFLAKSDDHDDLHHDARELLKRNVGG